ncbi:thioredoxin family protein [Lysinibacillus sp. KU-BSD001]|uniref:thioredoxin family protein n=1 Tax=Lysinibacillus sp. KU-BSD001 TaxID=3141328 RepID=UPI0036E67321
MKKLGIIGAVVVLLFGAMLVLQSQSNSSKLKNNPYGTEELQQSTIDLLDDENYQNIILPEDLQKKIDSGKGVFAYLFSPLCGYCKQFTPTLMPVAKDEGIQIDQLNVLEFENAWTTYKLEGTPTLIYFENGKEVTRLYGGNHSADDVRQFFESVGK